MNVLLIIELFLPLLGMALMLGTPHRAALQQERQLAGIALGLSYALLTACVLLIATWAIRGFAPYSLHLFNVYAHGDFVLPFTLYWDGLSAAYLLCSTVIFSVIVKFSRVYLHREPGYQRFFVTITAFIFGVNLIVLAGSIDVLFAGWEIAGIASFLLIAFYRHRPQPIRNALRAYTIYRLCDVGLLLSAWLSHALWPHHAEFGQFATWSANGIPLTVNDGVLMVLAGLLILASAGKSAQFPFCFWLPRAMEGPTPSSAIFYGALSIHLGVFLLWRTEAVWGTLLASRLLILLIGLCSVVIARLAKKTQANIKGQIAYASISQVGLMFIELALGLDTLVIVHFLGNAFLRCYQLLLSPSVVSHLLRVPRISDDGGLARIHAHAPYLPASLRDSLPEVLHNTLYVFALQEGGLDRWVKRLLWDPLQGLGKTLRRFLAQKTARRAVALGALALAIIDHGQLVPSLTALIFATAMLVLALLAFSETHHPYRVWHAVGTSNVCMAIAAYMIHPHLDRDILPFALGIVPAWGLGVAMLRVLQRYDDFMVGPPFRYHALAERAPRWAWLLLLSFLGLASFPITPAFLGIDLLLAHADPQHPWLVLPVTLAFVLNGIALARVYTRLCFGNPSMAQQ